tara:strand:- start:13716 stop:14141 length:426 start_codon:yes stop_codon:yes gene_type:complete
MDLIRKHLEKAEEELRQALIKSLNDKNDENLGELVEALSKVKEILMCTPIRNKDGLAEYYRNKAEYDFKLDSPFLNDNVINFPSHGIGALGDDHIRIDTGDDCTNNASFEVKFSQDLSSDSLWSKNDIITFGEEEEDKKTT